MITFPHCDVQVLYVPGDCVYCDAVPELQAVRINLGINFTGQQDPSLLQCPAERRRPLELIERWGGNVKKR